MPYFLPSEDIRIDARLPLADVLRRLRDEADDWHESKLAPEARRAGITGYRLRIDAERGTSARLSTKPQPVAVCDLALHPIAGGVRCVAVLRLSRPLAIGMGVWAGFGAIITFGGTASALLPWPGIGEAVVSLGASTVTFGLLLALGYGLVRLWWHRARFQRAELRRVLLRVTATAPDASAAAV